MRISIPDEPAATEPKRELINIVNLDNNRLERRVGIGSELNESFKDELVQFLCENVSTFAWSIEDMRGIDPRIMSHELNVDPTYKLIKQK